MRRLPKNPPRLPDEVLERLATSLVPLTKDTRFTEPQKREALLSLSNPAAGRFTTDGVGLIGGACAVRGWDSRTPEALRILKGGVPGYLMMEPVLRHDPQAGDQYPLNWSAGNRRVSISLTGALAPMGLEVPEGWVWEVPVSLVDFGRPGRLIVLHIGDRTERAEKRVTRRKK